MNLGIKPDIRIKDAAFAHDLSSSVEKPPTFLNWVRDDKPVDDKTFVTDGELFKYSGGIAWLIEPPSINPSCYQYIYNYNQNYKYVLTFLKELLDLGQNYLFYPFGASRLQPSQYQIYEKSKNCSFILSNKQTTEGHKLRHYLKDLAAPTGKVDVFQPADWVYIPKIDACKDYRFSVVVENGRFSSYFTEKIIDCFLTGTVPIYWGCPSLGEFFDLDGVIWIDSEQQYLKTISQLSPELYESKIPAIKKNFELAKNYSIAEDWIFRHYPFLFQ